MTKKITFLALIVLLAGLALAYSARDRLQPHLMRALSGESSQFAAAAAPAPESLQLYDMGIVDANGDDRLDIYTSAHNYRQNLWLADGKGGYQDVLSQWGLDQSQAFPGGEQSLAIPRIDKPGLYIYWQDDLLHLVAHQVDNLGPWKGELHLYNMAEVMRSDGFIVENSSDSDSPDAVPVSKVSFAAQGNGHLVLYISTRGTPLTFHIDAPWARSKVFVGAQSVVPASNYFGMPAAVRSDLAKAKPPCAWCQNFELTLRDRHGFAWSDYNDDGQLDIFIPRRAGRNLTQVPPQGSQSGKR